MKLFSGDIKKNIKDTIKAMKSKLAFSLSLIIMLNGASVYASINNTSNNSDNSYSMEQDWSKVSANVGDEKLIQDMIQYNYYSKEKKLFSNANQLSYKYSSVNYANDSRKPDNKSINMETIGAYSTLVNKNFPKRYLVNAIIDETIKEMSSESYFYTSESENNNEITVNNMDFFSIEEKIKFVCDKYGLTDFQFKVIASVVYNETFPNNYDDCYRVINTIYNRTKSKKWVDWISSSTGLNGASMYAQVIAPYQFDGCLSTSGYDYDELMNTVIYDGTKPFETTLDAIFDFLISEKSVHNFLSFKGIYWEVDESEKIKAGYGITDWVNYTDLGNTYHNPLTESDLIDKNYKLVSVEENKNVLSRKRG